jgi:hypothetical protein
VWQDAPFVRASTEISFGSNVRPRVAFVEIWSVFVGRKLRWICVVWVPRKTAAVSFWLITSSAPNRSVADHQIAYSGSGFTGSSGGAIVWNWNW